MEESLDEEKFKWSYWEVGREIEDEKTTRSSKTIQSSVENPLKPFQGSRLWLQRTIHVKFSKFRDENLSF